MENWMIAKLPTTGAPLLQVYSQKRPIANVCRWEYPRNEEQEDEIHKLIGSTPLLLDALIDMVAQHCTENDGTITSLALSANAFAIKLLADLGEIELTISEGRIVKGNWKVKSS